MERRLNSTLEVELETFTVLLVDFYTNTEALRAYWPTQRDSASPWTPTAKLQPPRSQYMYRGPKTCLLEPKNGAFKVVISASPNSQNWFTNGSLYSFLPPMPPLIPPHQQVCTKLATHSSANPQPMLQHKAHHNIRIYHIPKFELHQPSSWSATATAHLPAQPVDPNSQQLHS